MGRDGTGDYCDNMNEINNYMLNQDGGDSIKDRREGTFPLVRSEEGHELVIPPGLGIPANQIFFHFFLYLICIYVSMQMCHQVECLLNPCVG